MNIQEEREKMLYVEFPNLLHKILKMTMLPSIKSKKVTEITIDEIKKITNAECQSALVKFKS